MSGATEPTFPFAFGTDADTAPPRRRRRRWPWLIALLVVLVLLVVAALVGEWLARDAVTKGVKQAAVTGLGVPADTEIDVDIPGSLLLQLIGGTIGEATVSSPEIAVDAFTGGLSATVHDLDLGAGPAIAGGTVDVTLDAAQLRGLMATVDGFPADTLGLAAPDVTASTSLDVFGASIALGLGLRPGADGGDLVLTPDALSLGGTQLTADDLRAQLGGLADGVLRDWRVCVAQYLPAPLTLSGVEVAGDRLVARFDVAAVALTDAALQAKGTCS